MRNVPEKEPLILEAGQRAIGMKEATHPIYPLLYVKQALREFFQIPTPMTGRHQEKNLSQLYR